MQSPASRCEIREVLFISFLLLAVFWGVQTTADETRLRDIDNMLQEGRNLSVEQVASLETRLTQNPKDFDARIRLLGYYGSRVNRSAQGRSARDKLEPHVLRLIEHYPGSEIFTGTYWEHAERHVLLDPNGNAHQRAAKLWMQAIKENENDAQVLGNGASFLLTYPDEESGDRDQTEALLRRAQKLDPKNPRWSMDFIWLYAHDRKTAEVLTAESKQAVLKQAFEYLEESYARTQETLKTSPLSADERRDLSQGLDVLESELSGAAFAAQDPAKAKKYATALLESARQEEQGWNYGNIIHNANLILGRIALNEGKIDQAKHHLLEAGKTPGSPQLNSFGPGLSLARELLEKGERQVVIEFLNLCAKFWKMDRGRLDTWTRQLREGEVPDFGGSARRP